jgi:O-antigen ligase
LLATLYLRDQLPAWSGTSVTVPLIKGGDYAVQLAGIFAFTFLGLGSSGIWWTLIVIAEAILGMGSRGGLVAFLGSCSLIVLLRPRASRILTAAAVALALIASMAALDVRFTPPGTTREVSLDVLTSSLLSVVSDSERTDLENTKGWRLNWWARIWDYTFDGPYFWTGKGYGLNLADSDGFQVGTRDEPLRSPHNSHLTLLARSGVPGFFLWVALQLTWAATMIRSYLRARKFPSSPWSALFAWVLAFWIAFIIEAGFDVSLEGPMAGIPFWTVFGLGWGICIVFTSSASRAGRPFAAKVDP